jgi:CDP-glycerol glycerophosphotransferase
MVKELGQFPPEIILVNYCSIKAFFELASAKVWVDNCRKSLFPLKRKKQIYFQTWHGGIALKKIEKDAEDKLSLYYVKKAKRDSLMIDYCISNSKQLTELYTESFWYKGEILEYGSPRNDLLVNRNNNDDIVKQNLSLSSDCKIVLYVPTFRKNQSFDAYRINYAEIINTLQYKFGNKWYFLVRLHPNLIMKADSLQIPEWVINVTSYPDVQELLLITNVLISDYSSVMFDFMLTKRPVFIYADDYSDYKNDRGTYFPLDKTPFLIAENNDQLVNNIMSFDDKNYNKKMDDFLRLMGIYENGNASKLVVDKIYC